MKKVTLAKVKSTPVSDFSYAVIDNKAVIGGYSGKEVNIVLPPEIDGYQTALSPYAFKDSEIESIVLPDGLEVISYGAFQDCEHLKSVTIPESVSEISERAFRNCKQLENAELPHSITSIAREAFAVCESLSDVKLPDGLTFIGDGAFFNTDIRQISIPFSVTYMGGSAFAYCNNLLSVHIEGNFKAIKEHTFQGCRKLMTVSFGTKCIIQTIQEDAFQDCRRLTAIKLPDTVKMIETEAFAECAVLSEVAFPNHKVKVRRSAFVHSSYKPEKNKNIIAISDPIGYLFHSTINSWR